MGQDQIPTILCREQYIPRYVPVKPSAHMDVRTSTLPVRNRAAAAALTASVWSMSSAGWSRRARSYLCHGFGQYQCRDQKRGGSARSQGIAQDPNPENHHREEVAAIPRVTTKQLGEDFIVILCFYELYIQQTSLTYYLELERIQTLSRNHAAR